MHAGNVGRIREKRVKHEAYSRVVISIIIVIMHEGNVGRIRLYEAYPSVLQASRAFSLLSLSAL
jgi:rRNA maturation protein Rpf1